MSARRPTTFMGRVHAARNRSIAYAHRCTYTEWFAVQLHWFGSSSMLVHRHSPSLAAVTIRHYG